MKFPSYRPHDELTSLGAFGKTFMVYFATSVDKFFEEWGWCKFFECEGCAPTLAHPCLLRKLCFCKKISQSQFSCLRKEILPRQKKLCTKAFSM